MQKWLVGFLWLTVRLWLNAPLGQAEPAASTLRKPRPVASGSDDGCVSLPSLPASVPAAPAPQGPGPPGPPPAAPVQPCSASSHEPRCTLISAPSPARVAAGLRRVNVSTRGRPSSLQHKLGIVETAHFRISFGKHSGCFLQRVIYPPGVSLLSSRGRKA